jgi:hypothetical protein
MSVGAKMLKHFFMNNTREKILHNLRQAAAKTTAIASHPSLLPAHEDAAIYHNYQPAQERPLQIFAEKLAKLKGEFYHAGDETAAAKMLRQLISQAVLQPNEDRAITPSSTGKATAQHRHPLIDRIFAVDQWLAENVQAIDRQLISSADFAAFAVIDGG